MLYKVECLLIPENYVRISMKTDEFNKLFESEFGDIDIVYLYKGARYLFMNDDCVVEELINGSS